MDVIGFEQGDVVLYRPVGQHLYVPGVEGVVSVTPTNMELPREGRRATVTNLCGAFLCPFYKQGREQLLVDNANFGGHKVIHHIDGLLQVRQESSCSLSSSVTRECRAATMPEKHCSELTVCVGGSSLAQMINLSTACSTLSNSISLCRSYS